MIHNSLILVKVPLNPKDMKGVYLVPYSCGTTYIRETSRSINQGSKEHSGDIKKCRTHCTTLAEHVGKMKHHINIEVSEVIVKYNYLHNRKYLEANEVEKSSKTLNRNDD